MTAKTISIIASAFVVVVATTLFGFMDPSNDVPTLDCEEESLLGDLQNLEPLLGWAASGKVALRRHGQPLLVQHGIEIWKDGKLASPLNWESGLVFDNASDDASAGAVSICILQQDAKLEVRSAYKYRGNTVVGAPVPLNFDVSEIVSNGRLVPISSISLQPDPIKVGNEAAVRVFLIRDSENQKHGLPLGRSTFDLSDTRLYRMAVVLKVRARKP